VVDIIKEMVMSNYKKCKDCKQMKRVMEFPRTLQSADAKALYTCYECESKIFNPVITRRLVA